MYTLVKTYGLPVGSGTAWTALEAGESVLSTLFSTYQKLKIQVHESYTDQQQVIDLYTFQSELQNSNDTLNAWLKAKSDAHTNLRGQPGELSIKTHKLYCHDAITVGFLPKVGNSGYHPSNAIPESERTDILLTKANTNYENIGKHCLFTVGGYVHPHVYGKDVGVYIQGGFKTAQRSQENDIGMIDFSRIGSLEIHAITEEMIADSTKLLPYKDEMYLRLPRKVAEDETVALVFGGYLHLLDDCYTIVSDTTAKINCINMFLYERYFRSRKYLDLTSLGILLNEEDPQSDIVANRLLSDKALKAWVTHPCSFWVYIKATSIQVTQQPLPRSGVPGQYFLGKKPEGLIRADLGELPAYVQTYEKPLWVLHSRWGLRKNMLFENTLYKHTRVKRLNDTPYLHQVWLETHATLQTVHKLELIDSSQKNK